jgi:two-component system, OmpR family, response regulator
MAADRPLSAPGMRLLCVDDDRIHALLFGELCRAAGGVELAFAETADEALRVAADWSPQVVVVDLHLPDGDGLSLLPRLRAAAGAPLLRAVLCTAEPAGEVAQRAGAAGYDGCWPKPAPVDELRAVLIAAGRDLATTAAAGRPVAGR